MSPEAAGKEIRREARRLGFDDVGIAPAEVPEVEMPGEPKAIAWERVGDITIVRFTANRITDIDYSKKATDELKYLVVSLGGKMVVSLKNVMFMSSVGVSILVDLNKQLRSVGGRLKVCDVQPLVGDVFRSIELDKALDLYETRAEAMALITGRGHQEEGEAVGKWRRALLTQGQLSTYFVGWTEVIDLVGDLRAARPGATDRQIHDELLDHGSPPVRHLRPLLGC